MIEVHYAPTMNGHKVALMLEEIELPYKLIHYRIFEGDHLTPEYRAINPNFKIPTIVDLAPADGGAPLAVFETGAILFYLGEKTGRFIPNDFRRREEARQWLTWQVAGLGPMHGQANHFMRYAPAGQDYAIERYSRESRRLVAVLEHRLETVDYLAGDEKRRGQFPVAQAVEHKSGRAGWIRPVVEGKRDFHQRIRTAAWSRSPKTLDHCASVRVILFCRMPSGVAVAGLVSSLITAGRRAILSLHA